MKNNYLFLGLGACIGVVLSVSMAAAWQGPPAGTVPPNGTFDAPINTGNSSQIKFGPLSLNNLQVAGNAMFSGGYLNFGGSLAGNSGYGIRDNSGTMEYRNTNGLWTPMGASGKSSFGKFTTIDSQTGAAYGWGSATLHQAATDGFVMFWTSGPSNPSLSGYTCTSNQISSCTTIVAGSGFGSGGTGGLMMPVRAGDYWYVARSGASGAGGIHWLPLSL